MKRPLLLRRLSGDYTVARLAAADAIPVWADGAGFVSISRSDDELSIACLAARVPATVRQDGPWTCFKLVGPFAFDETGIVLAVVAPLSAAGLGVFVVSSFDSDHLLVKCTDSAAAIAALQAAGHAVTSARLEPIHAAASPQLQPTYKAASSWLESNPRTRQRHAT